MKTPNIRALLLICVLGFSAPAAERPNILLIMSDDMGFSDLGCYGSEIQTPNLDALAQNGIRFTQFYNMARCCPTRASLLTGLYPHQAGVGHMTADRGNDGYRGQLNRRCTTLAEVLRPGGYRTYMCGKWHVCRDIKPDSDNSVWPLQRGFEKFYGTITGGGSFYDPTSLCRHKPMQGVSLRPAFNGRSLNRHQPIFWEHEGNRAVRDGRWKLVAKENQPWELYDMEQDRSELKDLSGPNPRKVQELAAKWDAWAARADVLPLGAWRANEPAAKKKR